MLYKNQTFILCKNKIITGYKNKIKCYFFEKPRQIKLKFCTRECMYVCFDGFTNIHCQFQGLKLNRTLSIFYKCYYFRFFSSHRGIAITLFKQFVIVSTNNKTSNRYICMSVESPFL